MKALLKAGFTVPKALVEAPPTNVGKDKYYDQIVFQTRPGRPRLPRRRKAAAHDARAGSVDLFEGLYTADRFGEYRGRGRGQRPTQSDEERSSRTYYLEWRTYQFSDHLPLWVRLKVDDSAKYLESLD